MGHYDDLYAETEREDRARTAREAASLSSRHRVPVLSRSTFRVLGVCETCANLVYSVPNWGCRSHFCPHKP